MKLADRVRETSTSTGTGAIALAGAVEDHQSFADGIGDNEETIYAVVHQGTGEWIVARGTLTVGTPDSLSRAEVLASSAGGANVDFTAGEKDVFVTYAAGRAFMDGDPVDWSTLTSVPATFPPEAHGNAAHSTAFATAAALDTHEASVGQHGDVDLAGAEDGQFIKRESGVYVPSSLAEPDIPSEIVRETRQVGTGLGLQGGGDLSANRTLSAVFASQSQAEDGVHSSVVMSPLRTAQAIDALGGGGGGLELLASSTGFSVSGYLFSGLDTSGYTSFLLVYAVTHSTNNTRTILRIDDQTTNYRGAALRFRGGQTSIQESISISSLDQVVLTDQFSGTRHGLALIYSSAAGRDLVSVVGFSNAGSNANDIWYMNGSRSQTTTPSSLRLMAASGSFSSSSHGAELYGIG